MIDAAIISWGAAVAVPAAFVIGLAGGWSLAFKLGFPMFLDRLHDEGVIEAGPSAREKCNADLERRFFPRS